MKKKVNYIILGVLTIVLIAALVTAANTNNSKQQINECKKVCSSDRRVESKICNDNYKECREVCRNEKKDCLDSIQENYSLCKDSCSDLNKTEKRECKRNCTVEKNLQRRECSKTDCLKNCRIEKTECRDNSKTNYYNCKSNCINSPFNVDQQQCEDANGFYHQICNGPYFDIVCSVGKYCICDGENNYGCPSNYTCEHNIDSFLPRRSQTIGGFKDLLGNELGDIGICKKQ